MMADHQTTGGYTKIANVISVDLPVLAQCMPGMKIHLRKSRWMRRRLSIVRKRRV